MPPPVRCYTCGKPMSMWHSFHSKRKEEVLRTGDSNCNLTSVFDALRVKRMCCRVTLKTSFDWEAEAVLPAPDSVIPTSRLNKIRTMTAHAGTLRLEERDPDEVANDPVPFVKPKRVLMKAGMRVSEKDMLTLYKYYKQGSLGDIPRDRAQPSIFEAKERAKHNAWASVKGASSESARAAYVTTVERLSAAAVTLA